MINQDVEKDLLIAKYMLNIDSNHIPYCINNREYGAVYPWTNERIECYYNYLNQKNKNALAITSSGDHVIYAALAENRLIDACDINHFTKYYSALKIALLRTYDVKQFKKCFKTKKTRIVKVPILNKIDLSEIKTYLTYDELYFWSNLIKRKHLINEFLYRFDGFFGRIIMPDYVRDEQLYKKLQKNLETCKITYYDIDLSQEKIVLPNKYDCIYLSNVLETFYQYVDRLNVMNNCQNALNEDGKIITYILNRCSNSFLRKQCVEDVIGNALIIPNKQYVKK